MTRYHEDDDVAGKIYDAALMRRLLPVMRPHWRVGALAALLSVASVAAEVYLPWLYKHAIDVNIAQRDAAGLLRTGMLYLALMTFSFALNCALIILLATVGQRVLCDMRMRLFSHLQGLSLSFFNKNPVGRLLTRLSSDVELLTQLFTDVILNSFRDVLVLVGAVSMMLACDWRLTLQVLVVLPLMLAATTRFRRHVRRAFRETRRTLAMANAYLAENIAGIRTVQAFVRERKNSERYRALNHDFLRANLNTIAAFAVYLPSVDLITRLGMALVVLFGGQAVFAGRIEIGVMFAFLGWVEMFFRPIRNLSQKYNTMQMAMASAERICDLFDTAPEITAPARPKPLERAAGRIEFRDVWFAYQGEEWVLRGVSFVVEPGETVALVGRTGAGKTTIISLLCRFYDPQRGCVLLDGVDLREYDPQALRRQISLVQQDLFLFSDSVRFNIALGDETITARRIHEVSRRVNADRFIARLVPPAGAVVDGELPAGYSAEVGERGVTLSVGERQLICFARALVKDPVVLALDEATSSIDTETERLIQDAQSTLLAGRSALVVAHRLSTIERAHRILVLHRGEVREQGTHQELLALGGLYARLYALQSGEPACGDARGSGAEASVAQRGRSTAC